MVCISCGAARADAQQKRNEHGARAGQLKLAKLPPRPLPNSLIAAAAALSVSFQLKIDNGAATTASGGVDSRHRHRRRRQHRRRRCRHTKCGAAKEWGQPARERVRGGPERGARKTSYVWCVRCKKTCLFKQQFCTKNTNASQIHTHRAVKWKNKKKKKQSGSQRERRSGLAGVPTSTSARVIAYAHHCKCGALCCAAWGAAKEEAEVMEEEEEQARSKSSSSRSSGEKKRKSRLPVCLPECATQSSIRFSLRLSSSSHLMLPRLLLPWHRCAQLHRQRQLFVRLLLLLSSFVVVVVAGCARRRPLVCRCVHSYGHSNSNSQKKKTIGLKKAPKTE